MAPDHDGPSVSGEPTTTSGKSVDEQRHKLLESIRELVPQGEGGWERLADAAARLAALPASKVDDETLRVADRASEVLHDAGAIRLREAVSLKDGSRKFAEAERMLNSAKAPARMVADHLVTCANDDVPSFNTSSFAKQAHSAMARRVGIEYDLSTARMGQGKLQGAKGALESSLEAISQLPALAMRGQQYDLRQLIRPREPKLHWIYKKSVSLATDKVTKRLTNLHKRLNVENAKRAARDAGVSVAAVTSSNRRDRRAAEKPPVTRRDTRKLKNPEAIRSGSKYRQG